MKPVTLISPWPVRHTPAFPVTLLRSIDNLNRELQAMATHASFEALYRCSLNSINSRED